MSAHDDKAPAKAASGNGGGKPDGDVSIVVDAAWAGRPLDGVVRNGMGGSWGAARELIRRGKVFVDDTRVVDEVARLKIGQRVDVRPKARRADGVALDDAAIVFVDTHIVVVRKPSGISTIPYEPGERGTLQERTHAWLVRRARHAPNASLGVVHRIDKGTSGLVVFARTHAAKKVLAQAFRAHAIERRYIAIVHGILAGRTTFRSHIVEDRGDGLRGAHRDRGIGERTGQLAITHAAPIGVLSRTAGGDGATAIACALETGRTHQIRVHLSEAQMPLVGDTVYTRDRLRAGRTLIEAPRLMLHAMLLGFEHPMTQEPLRFVEPLPADIRAVGATLSGAPFDVDPAKLPI